MQLHVLDGTYELFRAYFGAPPAQDANGREVGACRAFARSLLALLKREDVTHVAVAFDHVIESFRNRLFDGYKTGEGIDPDLLAQFPLVEAAAAALGVVVWPMVEFEADDALASAATQYLEDFERVVIASPDKDFAQCVRGQRVVMWDRRRELVFDECAVVEKFGVQPCSIPDYLALVGDSADGIPGIPKWGAKSSSTLLAHYGHVDAIPRQATEWAVKVRGSQGLSASLEAHRDEVALYRRLATLRTDVPLNRSAQDLCWRGVDDPRLESFCEEVADARLLARARAMS